MADVFDLQSGLAVGTVFDGASLSGVAGQELYFELAVPMDLEETVGSVEILVDGVAATDNSAPYSSLRTSTTTGQTVGAVLGSGTHTVRARFYEQVDLGGSFIGESTITFTVD